MSGALFTLAFRLLLLFVVIAAGYASYKFKIIDEHTCQQLTNYLMKIAIPILLVTAVGTEPISDGSVNLLYCGIIMACYYLFGFGGMLLYGKLRGYSRAKRAVTTCMSVIPNVAFIGLPLTKLIVGEQAVPYIGIMMTAFNVVFFTVGMMMFNKENKSKFDWHTLITPCNGATVVMCALLAFNIQLDTNLYQVLSQIGSMVTPLALLIIGINLARTQLTDALKNPMVWILSAMKLLILPILVSLIITPFGFPVDMRMALIIGLGCPGSALAAVIANQNDMEPELASQCVAHSTAFCIITLPVLIVGMQSMLGIL